MSQSIMSMTLVHRKVPPLIITLSLRDVALKLVGRVSREVSDEAVGIFQIEDLENGVVGGLVLAFYDGVGMHISLTAMLFSKTALP